MCSNNRLRAFNPPADAPIPTTVGSDTAGRDFVFRFLWFFGLLFTKHLPMAGRHPNAQSWPFASVPSKDSAKMALAAPRFALDFSTVVTGAIRSLALPRTMKS